MSSQKESEDRFYCLSKTTKAKFDRAPWGQVYFVMGRNASLSLGTGSFYDEVAIIFLDASKALLAAHMEFHRLDELYISSITGGGDESPDAEIHGRARKAREHAYAHLLRCAWALIVTNYDDRFSSAPGTRKLGERISPRAREEEDLND